MNVSNLNPDTMYQGQIEIDAGAAGNSVVVVDIYVVEVLHQIFVPY